MGIQGLLPLLKSIMNPIHIKELEGCFVAVDTYSWLHKGALSCSTELCKGLPTTKHINYCMHRVNLLRHYGVKPILVFDGGPLPMKSEQEIKRERSRKENLSRAMEHESNGNLRAAYEFYQKAVDITPSIAHDLIQVLKQENVSYVVAPYEADAQMTFLAITKHVEAVITEDSDLIAFGCPRIIYKMDKFGQGVEFKNTMLQHNKELDLAGFTQTMLLEMCILSGCDYLQSLPGMGLKKAHALIKKFKSHDKVIKHLKYNSIEITPDYEESFKRAILTFRHQRVYDPESEDIAHLTEPPADCDDDDLDFLGPLLPQHVAIGVAQGDLDPFTKAPMQDQTIAAEKIVSRAYHAKTFKPTVEKKKIDLPVQKNLVTNYFCFASLEAKRNFKAPRITPTHANDKTGTSKPVIDVHKVKRVTSIDNLAFRDARGHGASDEKRLGDYLEMQPLCKPCTSLHKDIELDGKSRKPESENKNVVVRSRYFMKKSIEEEDGKENKSDMDTKSDEKFEDAISNQEYKLFSALLEGTCRKEEKRPTTIRSSYFQQNIMHDSNSQRETENKRINSIRSSCDEETFLSEHDDPESEDLVISSGDVTENCNYNSRSFSGNNSSEFAIKKRKISPTLSPVVQEDTNGMNLISSGTCSSDIEEDTDTKEVEKFGCNISHLDRYSNIAEKSMDKFVSVISSFRYNSTGSRASGLRAPLKEIKNNSTRSLKADMDLSKFAYKPMSENPSSRCAKSKI